jgi:hypothetical protein
VDACIVGARAPAGKSFSHYRLAAFDSLQPPRLDESRMERRATNKTLAD